VGIDLSLRAGTTTVALRDDVEYALIVLRGAARVDERVIEPGYLVYLGVGRVELRLAVREPTRALLIGGVPFDEPVTMWWNYVARTREEILDAHHSWMADDGRFGRVDSRLARIEVPAPPWRA
jgi:redox-sensitive bicupin YhaK (pirin superfamily)